MSAGWEVSPLRNVVAHRKEFVLIEDTASYKRVRIQLHAQGVVLRDIVSGAQIKTKRQQVCHAGDFVVAEIDAKHGGFGIVPPELQDAIVSSHYFLFAIDESRLDRQFLNLFSKTPAFRNQVTAQGSTNYAAVRPADVLGYRIPLPPLSEQRRIVARIEALASRIREARRLRAQATDATAAILRAAMRGLLVPGDGHASVPLETVCSAIIDNLHSNPIYADSGVPCVRSPDIGWGTLNLATPLQTSEDEYRRRTVRGEPRTDDIVLVREGGGTGKAAIVEDRQRFSLGQRVMMLRPDPTKVVPRFLLYQILSPAVYDDQILPRCKGSASPHLNIGALRRFSFVLPELDEQRRIVDCLNGLQAKVNAVCQLQHETEAALDALMPATLERAFRGEL